MSDVKRPRRPGRPALTDRTALLAAAREIGFPELTVGAVTARVGVKYSTFYRHFAGFEAMVAMLVDELLAEARLPAADVPGGWPAYLRDACDGLFDLFAEHPGLVQAAAGLTDVPARLLEVFREATDLMLADGLDAEDATLGANAAMDLVVMPWIATTEHGSPGIVRRRQQITTTDVPLDPRVRSVISEDVDDPPRAWTAHKIDLLIASLARDRSTGRP